MHIFAFLSYYLYKDGKFKFSFYAGLIYCGMCLFSIGHYYQNPPSFYPMKIHFLLLAEVVPAFMLLCYHIWLNRNPIKEIYLTEKSKSKNLT